ncbi:MAG: bifunctional alpha,alpha-trehalose-phosphate synthase (UDP-forming)/trehalose-phosphatase [Spirochaetes bacterium]|jgi:trehalose 6-phosphate synthase/phosphatase|nr:bifunctional alpha,alpha-trehalose-phosphate synthase (UDP-forming)/trehalose-phosphatase [Spirochaetota bacterium]
MNDFERIVIIANRSPFSIITEKNKKTLIQNSGGLVSAMASLSEKMIPALQKQNHQIIWVGNSEFRKADFEALEPPSKSFDFYPVAIPEDIYKNYYHGFSNDTLWPLFHYFPRFSIFKDSYYDAYVEANRLFLKQVEKIIRPGDFIWVHDYQLLLLPQMLRKKFPKANIGFFLHIPFPSYEIYRLLNRKWREELLEGILGADLIGFHTNDYTQNFLQTVRRILGNDNTIRKIFTPERIIKTDAFPIGIDYNKFFNALDDKAVKIEIKDIEKDLNNCKLIFSVDRLDYTKGIMNRLTGLEIFLEKYPEWHDKMMFNMVVVPSRDTIPRYQKMKREIEAAVGRINGKFGHLGWRPIIYQYKSLNFEQLVALYSLSHVGLITPLRDGMNLVAKEYITCQGKNVGVLILSEFAGAVAELGEALIINPNDSNEIAEAIKKALEMELEEREERIQKMRKRIESYDIFAWAEDFVNQFQIIKKEQSMLDVKIVNNKIENRIKEDYRTASNRIILLDYDGTLVPFSRSPEKALPGRGVIEQLKKISGDEKNKVIIISGRDKKFLYECFGELNIILIAEHGFLIKYPGSEWSAESEMTDNEWKKNVKPLIKKYADRCAGSFIEEKESALVWHYRGSESDFALVRSQELKEELMEFLLYHKDLQLIEGNKNFEIKKTGYDKGTSITKLFQNQNFDFVLAIGDDRTDEDLFKALPNNAYSIKVGLIQSNAKYNLTHQYEVNDLINKLIS